MGIVEAKSAGVIREDLLWSLGKKIHAGGGKAILYSAFRGSQVVSETLKRQEIHLNSFHHLVEKITGVHKPER